MTVCTFPGMEMFACFPVQKTRSTRKLALFWLLQLRLLSVFSLASCHITHCLCAPASAYASNADMLDTVKYLEFSACNYKVSFLTTYSTIYMFDQIKNAKCLIMDQSVGQFGFDLIVRRSGGTPKSLGIILKGTMDFHTKFHDNVPCS